MPKSHPDAKFKSLIPLRCRYLLSFQLSTYVLKSLCELRTPSPPHSSSQNPLSVIVCQFIKHADTYYHDQKSNSHNNEQCESKPAQYHCRRPNSAVDAAVAEILGDGTSRHRSCVLP